MKKHNRIALVLTLIAALLTVNVYAGGVLFQNGGANSVISESDSLMIVQQNLEAPVDVSAADYLYVRFYIENADLYSDDGNIEISSGGNCDVEEYSWYLSNPDYELVSGWNEWILPLDNPWYVQGGEPNLSAINYFRVYAFTAGANLLCVDYIGYGAEGEDFTAIATELGGASPETEAPVTEAPATEAPATEAPAADAPEAVTPAAPATADFGIAAAALVLASAAAVVLSSKKR